MTERDYMKRKNRQNQHKKRKLLLLAAAFLGAAAIVAAALTISLSRRAAALPSPEELLITYMNYIPAQEYEQMYEMLYPEASGNISKEDFITRNSAIYEGIEVQNMSVEITGYDQERTIVSYQTSFDTLAGTIHFENEAQFLEGEEGYALVWNDSLIFPGLSSADKVRVTTTPAERGNILDRNGTTLAGAGTATSVGIVPGKLENPGEDIPKIAELLEIEPETVEKKLSAQWVKDDSFVPIKTVPKVDELELMKSDPEEEMLREQERQEALLNVPGVMLSDTQVREPIW